MGSKPLKKGQIVQFEPKLDFWSPKGSKPPPDGQNFVMHGTTIHTADSKRWKGLQHSLWTGMGLQGHKTIQMPPVGPKCFAGFSSAPNFVHVPEVWSFNDTFGSTHTGGRSPFLSPS